MDKESRMVATKGRGVGKMRCWPKGMKFQL